MDAVKAKKKLGQHFLTDYHIAQNIVNHLSDDVQAVLEIGPGMGMLTQFLLQRPNIDLVVVEIDTELAAYLRKHYPTLDEKIIEENFLSLDLSDIFQDKFALIGNFPYNISSQILFKALEYKDSISEIVGMFQKEVALRIASPPGNKDYGILSVLLQAFYTIEYLFSVDAHVFNPPPNVKSAVIRLTRNKVIHLGCNENTFKRLVKTAFNQRRKILRNSLKSLSFVDGFTHNSIFEKRPEQLSVSEFIFLTNGVINRQ
ncbi:MAG: 16S rRNA (adenine(1518)-N(6)/adenine(1519)-N(6))-dimethyltransferase RsmA [Bacteroidales bacterium]|jgi:16S rRNA (adenine1518-N6/adenine1519-N6)-dimethyltransferase|nr:16S rRNA (adenine(1518)-N(6)/adenine(1519)-N(6))-dimethyltransferase RsmA [Bacteroidales bacterium]